MRLGTKIGIQALILLVLWALPSSLLAQAPKPPSLKEQLEAQFPPGTVLAIQKEGILGVAPASSKTCAAKYQDGKLSPPDPACTAPLKNNSRPLTVGEKVYPGTIDVDLVRERISLHIVECDSCNKGGPSSGYKSQVNFQFAKGYLQGAGISQIEDTISEVLAFDAGTDQQAHPSSGEQPGSSGELTNNDVVKMVSAKLGDGIIISTIKASPCNFDTSVDGMVKLKTAGVSDAVIQAMRDAPPLEPPSPGGSVAGHYVNDKNAAEYLDLGPDGKFLLRERGRDLTGSYEFTGDTLTIHTPSGQTATAKGDGQRFIDTEGKNWVRQGEPKPDAPPGQLSFAVRHRHSNAAGLFVQGAQTVYYCSGTLSVSPDGTVAYDCAQTDDPGGRCEHVSFAPGSLKQVKIGLGRNLHLASKTQGNFDFYGNADDINRAQAAIAPLIQK